MSYPTCCLLPRPHHTHPTSHNPLSLDRPFIFHKLLAALVNQAPLHTVTKLPTNSTAEPLIPSSGRCFTPLHADLGLGTQPIIVFWQKSFDFCSFENESHISPNINCFFSVRNDWENFESWFFFHFFCRYFAFHPWNFGWYILTF